MKIGFIGLGTMGLPMATNLAKHFHLTVHNRTRSREKLVPKATPAQSPAEAASGADVVITIVSDTPDVSDVLFGPDGVASGASPGCVVVDMSTISPSATREFGARLNETGLRFVDAPVSGGTEGAANATLTIMAGGESEDVEFVKPIFEKMGSTITHVGPLGSGQLTKAVNQIIVGGTYLAVAEGLRFGQKAGLNMQAVLNAISAGSCRSWVLERRSDNILRSEFPLGFKLSLHRKDLGIALYESQINLPLSKLVAELEDELIAKDHGNEDLSAIARTLS